MGRSLKDYEWLLQRLYEKVPSRPGAGEHIIQEPEMLRIGDRVIIRNFKEITGKLKRDPVIVSRYLLKEMGTGGRYDPNTGQLILDSKISRATVLEFLQRFEKTYVRCPTCMSIDTKLEKRDRIWVLVCEACGAEQPVKPI